MRNLLLIVMFILAARCAEAHDIYRGLKDHLGQFDCCNETDCRPARYRVSPAGVQMLLDGEWVHVPDEIVQHRTLHGDTGETDGGHWCGTIYPAGLEPTSRTRFYTRCVILPPDLF
jgi:hypothetical protein